MISSLLYLMASRPDILFSVCLCARFQSCPKESHLFAVNTLLDILRALLDELMVSKDRIIFHDEFFGC